MLRTASFAIKRLNNIYFIQKYYLMTHVVVSTFFGKLLILEIAICLYVCYLLYKQVLHS